MKKLDPVARPVLDPHAAATLAAKLANDSCAKQFYDRKPFSSDQHSTSFIEGRWVWGEYDPAGPGGFSAMVTFNSNGSDPDVKIWLSSDSAVNLWPQSSGSAITDLEVKVNLQDFEIIIEE